MLMMMGLKRHGIARSMRCHLKRSTLVEDETKTDKPMATPGPSKCVESSYKVISPQELQGETGGGGADCKDGNSMLY